MPAPLPSLSSGQNVIRRYVQTMPGTPGVYRMLDRHGNVLYIGKARHLLNRVCSYLIADNLSDRLKRMVAQVASMDITTTRSEAEALLLEANLVRKLKPRYNVLLKDDKSFPYIFLSTDHAFPGIFKHRGAKLKKGKYFGPFVSAHAVDETITLLQRVFLLRPCSDNVFKNRTRPCLQYQIKRCSAPCVAKVEKEHYAAQVKQAADFLSGKSHRIQDALVEEMQELSLKMHYEKARVVRDRIRALAQVQHGTTAEMRDADVAVLSRHGKHCCIQLYSFRSGLNWGNRAFFPEHGEGHSDSEILSAFLADRYQEQPAPGLILVSHVLDDTAILEQALTLRTGYKVEILHPLRGEKRALVDQALKNAREALERKRMLTANQQAALEEVRVLFGIEDKIERIEIYDNSHIGGTHAVGAMVVAGPEGFQKTEYRKFNIKRESIAPGDDYAMLREVLTRRFIRFEHEEQDESKRPQLVLIDGGAGQVSAAARVFEELGVQGIVYAGIAKGPDRNAGREQFFLPARPPFSLPAESAALHYLQRLRDEAHRFAIGFHKSKRSKALKVSELDAIAGIGPKRKKALLNHFGSARAVGAAGIADLCRVEGIDKATAETIYAHFHAQ